MLRGTVFAFQHFNIPCEIKVKKGISAENAEYRAIFRFIKNNKKADCVDVSLLTY